LNPDSIPQVEGWEISPGPLSYAAKAKRTWQESLLTKLQVTEGTAKDHEHYHHEN
jgi:hypothetical protein